MDRRHFLARSSAALLAGPLLSGRVTAEGPPPPAPFPGLIVRELAPSNLEMPFSSLADWQTPTERFFVRSHFAVPKLAAGDFRLKVEGAVDRPREWTIEELRKFPARSRFATLECAGNGRVFLTPRQRGLLWQNGAVGNAEWTGIPLAVLLEQAGVKDKAVEVVLEGADRGTVAEPASPGEIAFARSLPLSLARSEDVLLAYRMNGEPLTPSHGFPLRAVVAGWYGMACVKWLTRILVVDKPFAGFWQTHDYSVWERPAGGPPSVVPVTRMEVKSAVARPQPEDVIAAGKEYRVFGAAWSGYDAITSVRVEVTAPDGSTVGGEAKFLPAGEPKPPTATWRLWEWTWSVPKQAGRYSVTARATDASGRTQPLTRDADRRSYMISHVIPVPVEVR